MTIEKYIHVEYEDLFELDLFMTAFNLQFKISGLNDY